MTNKTFFKTTLTATALLAASGYTVMAQAHCVGIGDNFGASGITALNTSATNKSRQFDTYVTV
ncbi:MAG: hypothetical protein ABL933_11770 [Methyloglobulus sp.]|nr:hypothetical protein [Methyloglobulus sp.]